MNNLFLSFTILIVFSCTNRRTDNHNKEAQISQLTPELTVNNPCPPDRIATSKKLEQIKLNDSTEQLFLNDTLWIEVIGKSNYGVTSSMSYLKLYRTNGLLEQEGKAIYIDHPIVDYAEHGKWKFYDCEGDLAETKTFNEGQLVNDN